MKDKVFQQLLDLIDSEILDIYEHFSIFNALFKVNAKEQKTKPYGAYDLQKMIAGFSQATNCKNKELLTKITEIFKDSGRKLSNKQYDILINKCNHTFISVFNNYKETFQQEFELNETLGIILKNTKDNLLNKNKTYIESLKILHNTKLDKVLCLTAISTIFAGISLIISIIALFLRF